MSFHLRRATPADLDVLVALFAEFASEQARLDPRLAFAEDAEMRQRNTLRDALRGGTYAVFVAERDGVLIGYQSAEHWYEPPLYRGGREVYLHELYVRPDARGQGIGRTLAQAAIDWARLEGAMRLRFSVLASNEASRALWTHLGATPLAQVYTLELADATPEPPPSGPLGFVV